MRPRLSLREYIELATEYWRYSDVAIFGINVLKKNYKNIKLFDVGICMFLKNLILKSLVFELFELTNVCK